MSGRWTAWPLGRLAAAGVGLLAGLPLLGEGLVNTRAGGDSPFLLVRVHQMVEALGAGVFPVRWMADAAYGLGYPFFHYYAALPFYVAALLRLWGMSYVAAIEAVQWLGLAGAGLGLYLLARELGASRRASLLGASIYSFTPFHLVNLYVRGDSLSEFFAFVWFPLILWSMERLGREKGPREVLALGASFGGLLLTHNISALIFTPFALAFGLMVWRGERTEGRARMPALGGGILLGLALAAWYWMPALLERDFVQLQEATTGYFHFAGHFRRADLVQDSLFFDYQVDAQGTPFAMGSVQAGVAVLSVLVLGAAWLRGRSLPLREAFWLLSLLGSSVLITPLSRPLWDAAPLLAFVQFPWRFLSVQGLAVGVVTALALDRLPTYRTLAAILAAGAVILAALGELRTERLLVENADVTADRIQIYEHFTGNIGSTVRAEYLPLGASPRPFGSSRPVSGPSGPAAISGQLNRASLLASDPGHQDWEVDVASERSRLMFPILFFPGWEATIDGHRTETAPIEGSGRLAIEVPQGRHFVSLRLGTTPLRAAAEAISLAGGVAAVILVIWRMRASRRHGVVVGLALAAAIGGGLLFRGLGNAAGDTTGDLVADFARSPFLHHAPEGIDYEGRTRLIAYSQSATAALAGDEIEIEILWSGSEEALEAEARLVSPAEHLFATQDTISRERAPIRRGLSVHRLVLPLTVAPGLYFPAIRVYEGERELLAREKGTPLGTVHLHPVRADNPRPVTGQESIVARFGDSIALTEISAAQTAPSELSVELTWFAIGSPGANYSISLRLADPSGAILLQRDTQPRYGLFPTSEWPAGHLLADRYVLPLPSGIMAGTDYRLSVVMYKGWDAGLPQIGEAELTGIALAPI